MDHVKLGIAYDHWSRQPRSIRQPVNAYFLDPDAKCQTRDTSGTDNASYWVNGGVLFIVS